MSGNINALRVALTLSLFVRVSPVVAQDNTATTAIVLKADKQGHFTGSARINEVAVPFMIDTGATLTVVPMQLASKARLPYGAQVEAHTAGGRVFNKSTVIGSLKLGDCELHNVDAHLSQHLSEVLIGMNVLKSFKINQTADSMTLTPNEAMQTEAQSKTTGSAPSAPVDQRPSSPITKQVMCDRNQRCITRFSN
ncbi:retropepsin-like aspartic protease family protein [Methylomonas rhizoryzae]|uniref:retropepsin-like aspartic protease family protein n=1 Tax=Methylomonas rhizoryzae TaxID=2608981 RepID=UPI001231F62C|nr:retropepsin-like aspartic protease [Methylomonas rhizoryzae]